MQPLSIMLCETMGSARVLGCSSFELAAWRRQPSTSASTANAYMSPLIDGIHGRVQVCVDCPRPVLAGCSSSPRSQRSPDRPRSSTPFTCVVFLGTWPVLLGVEADEAASGAADWVVQHVEAADGGET